MRFNMKSVLALLLALTFVLSCFAGCATDSDNETSAATKSDATDAPATNKPSGETDGATTPSGETGDATTPDGETSGETSGETTPGGDVESETVNKADEIAATKQELGQPDWGKKEFACLVQTDWKSEVYAEDGVVDTEGGSAQVLNDAVLKRNKLLEENCNLTFSSIVKATTDVTTAIKNEATTATGDFYIIDYKMGNNGAASEALSGTLHDWDSLGIDLNKSWWDTGTVDFALRGKVYFMTGDVNFHDDNYTYVLIFNKDLQKKYSGTVPNPYQTVLDWDWTLDYFNSVIQGISSDNGDGQWDKEDSYGFVTTYEFGNTLFIGSDLRYIKNDRTMETPELVLDANMDKALAVLEKSKQIYHSNNATFMSDPGHEGDGLECFKAGRALFYSEVASYLTKLSSDMDTDYGILPIPKYDKAQKYYRTWTYCGASCLTVTSAIKEADQETVGKIIQWYAMLSSEVVKPAYYDVMLTSRNVRDEESRQMLDIIFSNRVYDMAFYFVEEFGLYPAFRDSVYKNEDSFSRVYTSNTKRFDRKVKTLFSTLDNKK